MSRASGQAAAKDLAVLEIPAGLERKSFEAVVASRLMQLPIVDRLNSFLVEPRRFGEVRDYLRDTLQLDRDDAEHLWQTLMRWLLYFLPGQYARDVPSHTEIVVYRTEQKSVG